VLAHVTGQAAGVGYAKPVPDAAVSTDGSVLVTCAFAGGRRVTFPHEIVVEGYPLRLSAAGHAIGIDASAPPAAAASGAFASGDAAAARPPACIAFAMCSADGGRCFVQLAPVAPAALHAAEALPGLQRCAAASGCANRIVVGDDSDAPGGPVFCWQHSESA